MNTLFNVWIIPINHKIISKQYNSMTPPYVPIATGVEEKLLPRYREIFGATTVIKDIGPSIKMMHTREKDFRLARDCKVYEDMEGSLIIHELQREIDEEDFLLMFPETARVPAEQEDLDAVLCFSKRSIEYPFSYELFVPGDYNFL